MQRDNHRYGQRKAAYQHHAKAGFTVAEGGYGARDCPPTHRRASDSARQQRDWRRGYGEPNGDVVPRDGVGSVYLAHKQVSEYGGMLRRKADALNEPQRVFPIVRVNDVHGRKRRRQERRAS